MTKNTTDDSRSIRGIVTVLVCAGAVAMWIPGGAASGADPVVPSADADAGEVDGHKEEPVAPLVTSGVVLRSGQARTPGMIASRGGFVSVQVNVDGTGANIVGDAANEPSIAIDPTDPTSIVIGWRQFETIVSSFRQAGRAHSFDGGVTWTAPEPLEDVIFRSDPVLGADNNGTFYYLSLSTLSSMELFRSVNGGVTWSAPMPAFGGDKEWMVVDTSGSPGDGTIYTIWNSQFSCCNGDFSRLLSGAEFFDTPIQIPDPKMKWGTLDVGPDGELYLAGATLSLNGHVFASSQVPYAAGGTVFESVQTVALGGSTAFGGALNPSGLLGQVNISVDRSTTGSRGNIYILGSVTPSLADPLDVHFIRSIDGGDSWSAPIRINDDLPGTGAWQWMGTMSVAPNGRIDVVWLDTRNAANPNTTTTSELFYSFSIDGGVSWSSNIVLSPPFDSTLGFPVQEKMGDYFHMVSDVGGGNLAYAATFNGEEDVYFLRIPADCNGNGVPDDEDVLVGGLPDCNGNLIPDICESPDDCNGNSTQDICDLTAGETVDCNHNMILDECEDTTDCNNNSVQDLCELFTGAGADCNDNAIPDDCDIADGFSEDCGANTVPDECDIAGDPSLDLNGNGEIDICEPPPPPAEDTTGGGGHGQRYVEITASSGAFDEVIRVTPLSIPGLSGGADALYLGTPFVAPDPASADPGATFIAAQLVCEPVPFDFGAFGSIAVYGAEIVPSSKGEVAQYAVQRANAICPDLVTDESCWSTPSLLVSQGLFGDIVAPFYDPPAVTIQPDFLDVTMYVSKFLGEPAALSKPAMQLVKNIARPDVAVNFLDINDCVNSFLGTITYATAPNTTGLCTCPSSVICEAAACTGDADCSGDQLCDTIGIQSGRLCDDLATSCNADIDCAGIGGGACTSGYCVDPCGRCSP